MSSLFDPNAVVSRPGEPAWQIALLFPEQGDWSENDYLALDTGKLVEFEDGCIEVLPMPTLLHQAIVDYLHSLLKAFVAAQSLGRVFFAPIPVRLRAGKYREPDIFFLRPERISDMRTSPEGADLIVEVVSEGAENRKRDLEDKVRDYAEAGVSEYWIVDPELRRITVLTLEGVAYRLHGEFGPGQTATSVLLAGFAVDVNAVFAAGEGTEPA